MRYLSVYENFDKMTFGLQDYEVVDILQKCCQGVNIKKDIPIYRSLGGDLDENFYLIDPRKYTRASANTLNYYTFILDNEKEWKGFPKRKHGVVCSLNDSYMDNEFRVIPLLQWNEILLKYNIKEFKDPKWGICTETDIWSSFSNIDANFWYNADDLNYFISTIWENSPVEMIHLTDFKLFKQALSLITIKMIKNIYKKLIISERDVDNKKHEKYERMIKIMKEKNFSNLYQFVKYMYSPDGFVRLSYEDIQKHCDREQQNEIWTDKPVLYLAVDSDLKLGNKEYMIIK